MAISDHGGVRSPERRTFDGGESDRVRVRTVVDHEMRWISEELAAEHVVVERVPIGREVGVAPDVRREGDVLIVPIVEEVLVVEKRLVLKEELHVRKVTTTHRVEEPVSVCAVRALVDRSGLSYEEDGLPSGSAANSAAG